MNLQIRESNKFPRIYHVNRENGGSNLATHNLVPGKKVYGERLVTIQHKEYRLWDPYKSKLAAVILRGLSILPFTHGYKLLYLGAASGTTVSHVSDIVNLDGRIYSVEFSYRSLRELIMNVSSVRRNVFPIFADARFPEKYRSLVERVDGVYCDVAQSEQARILADNAEMFLKEEGYAFLAIKGRSIKSTGDLAQIFDREIDVLKRRKFKVLQTINLKPYDRAHLMVVSKYKP
jgi:fibrillarin-like pre-rRNA processing protein